MFQTELLSGRQFARLAAGIAILFITAPPALAVAIAQVAATPRVLSVEDANDIVFSHPGAKNSISQTRVADIAEDDQGFMWFGTQSGLNRYDGYEYKVFLHDRLDSGSLSDGYIRALLKDRSGALWVGNDQALDRFDPTSERFTRYSLKREGSGDPPTVSHLSQDSSGILWVGSGSGLYSLDPRSGQRAHFFHSAGDPSSLGSNNIKYTGEDREGRFWVVNDAGLDQLDRNTGQVLLHIPLAESREMSFVEDADGNLWIPHASGTGLALFDRRHNLLIPIVCITQGSADSQAVSMSAGMRAHDGSVWFATSSGLLRLDLEHGRLLRYRHQPGDSQSLTADNVTTLFEDRENHIWVGLHAAAPDFFSTASTGFRKLPYGPTPAHSMGTVYMVNSVYQARDQSIWLSYLGTLTHVDANLGRITFYGPKERGSAEDIVTTIEDAQGRVWFGTVGGGLARFEPRTGQFSYLRHDPDDPSSLSNDVVTHLLVDHAGRLWASTWDGFDLLDADGRHFRTYRLDTGTASQQYNSIAVDPHGILWVGSQFSGLHRFDAATGQFTIYRHDDSDPGTLSNNHVTDVYVDSAGMIWVGTQQGLNQFNPNTQRFTTWTVHEGLPGNAVSCILEDEAGQLWLSTNKGLAQFRPATGQFRNFSVADGLPGDDLTGWSACFRSERGEMFFGGYSGAVAFHPREVRDQTSVPRIVLTEFDLAGVPVGIGQHSPLRKSIGFTDQLTLAPDQNSFAVGFAALSFGSPATNRYRYRLEGFDQHWNPASADRRLAVYTALPPGHYTFRVTGSTARGPWAEAGVALAITILPHWWATWWFRASVAVCCILVITAFYYSQLRKMARQYEIRADERGRIARELHDSLLQGFQALILCVQTARNLLPSRPDQAVGVLDTALERGDRAIAEGRDTVQDLRSEGIVETDLGETLKKLAEEMVAIHPSAEPPACRVLIEGRIRALEPSIRDEVYRIAREAIRNAFRHARAKLVEAEVNYDDRQLVLRIRDDGAGIDSQVLRQGRRPGHWGLPGMHERAAAFGGKLTVWSELGMGTELELKIPRAIAYIRGRRRQHG